MSAAYIIVDTLITNDEEMEKYGLKFKIIDADSRMVKLLEVRHC